MRMIGHIADEVSARKLADYLFVQGIRNQIEPESTGWSIWVHEEEQLEAARRALAQFQADPTHPAVQQSTTQAKKLRTQEQEQVKAAQKRFFDRDRVWPTRGAGGIVTLILFALCLAAAYLTKLENHGKFVELFLMSKIHVMRQAFDLPEISQGEYWRMITPIFVHFGFLHIIFNMMGMLDLGTMVERQMGSWRYLLLVLALAVISNYGQCMFGGPVFGGMSGVLYGLFGYAWMRGKHDPASGLTLFPQTVLMMMIWFFACLFQLIPHVANAAHGVGLAVGMACGFVTARLARR